MKKEGILFQGLCIQERQRLDFVEEEGFYYEKRKPYPKAEKKYADVTYFLLYIISKNQMCREMVQDMETQWLEYLRERAGNSVYQGEGFWDSLSGEEKICAEAVLGLLEDIRGEEEERAELAWIGFWYLIYKGFQEVYRFFKNIPRTTFQVLCQRAGEKKQERCMGISYLCMEFLFAEELGVQIEKNGTYPLLYGCMKTCQKMWESCLESEKTK